MLMVMERKGRNRTDWFVVETESYHPGRYWEDVAWTALPGTGWLPSQAEALAVCFRQREGLKQEMRDH